MVSPEDEIESQEESEAEKEGFGELLRFTTGGFGGISGPCKSLLGPAPCGLVKGKERKTLIQAN